MGRPAHWNMVFAAILMAMTLAGAACSDGTAEKAKADKLAKDAAAVKASDDAWNAYERDDYATTFRLVQPLADGNDAIALYLLGDIYDKGLGVVSPDYVKAAAFYRKSADLDFPLAQFDLGRMYRDGRGVPQDYAEAVKWYRRAANHVPLAALQLGILYGNGSGVPQDYVEAHKWFNLAAARLDMERREAAIGGRKLAESKMTLAQIAEAQKLAREWKPE